jgi:hypothetical protein
VKKLKQENLFCISPKKSTLGQRTFHMKKLYAALVILISIVTNSGVRAQKPEAILDSINAGRKPEKIFTHFDKAYYSPGETIWFKSYFIVDGFPGTYSSVAKVELINPNGTVIQSQLLPVMVGAAAGNLKIPDSVAYGTYFFRLYSQHMISTGYDNSYYQQLFIYPDAGFLNHNSPVTDIRISFHPEGGFLVAEEQNNVAFFATDQDGRPVNINGVIKDQKENEVARIATTVNGMGKFEFKPLTQSVYTLNFTLPSGQAKSLELPQVRAEGAIIFVADEPGQKQLFIDSRFVQKNMEPSYVIGEMDQQLVFKYDLKKHKGHFHQVIPTKDLPAGLLHIGVFNDEHSLLAERTIFINNKTVKATADLTTVSKNVSPRAKNQFEFFINDSTEGNLSISVTDAGQTALPLAEENILIGSLVTTNLFMGSNKPLLKIPDLDSDGSNEAIDLLLLTHVYKWNWQTLSKLAAVPSPSFNEYFIPLNGIATNERLKRPLPDANLSFIIRTKDSAVTYFNTTTAPDGQFELQGLLFHDTADIYINNNVDKNRDKKVQVEIHSPPISSRYVLPVSMPAIKSLQAAYAKVSKPVDRNNISNNIFTPLEFDSGVVILDELIVRSRKPSATQELENRYSTGYFSGSSRATVDFIKEPPKFPGGNIYDFLKGRYSYLQVKGNYPNYMLVYRAMMSLGTGTWIPMSLYLDEMQVDPLHLTTVPMRDIAMVRIYSPGLAGQGGALAVYRKKGEDRLNNQDFSYMTKIRVPGFSPVSSFASPDYETSKKNNIRTDRRKTLHWNPSFIFLPEDGKIPVTFFNSDISRRYKISVQGFTTDGKLVHIEKMIE